MRPSDFPAGITMTMGEWIEVTHCLQRDGFGHDPRLMEGDERANFLLMNFFAAVCEVVEVADETGWKPWSQPRGWVNRDKVISEVCDVLHFLGNVLDVVSCNGAELTKAYVKKVEINYERQAKGDDVRDRRCPGCGRSLDDVGTHVDKGLAVCNACGEVVIRELKEKV